ncbi:SulP family inorganic anion transporter [uncultured Microscilla sp.]|uniref:SulP family inorganic anion transporter n=1 Tax=uncultured Microscilla sp. TaxID=432653 RepID=UPI0026202CCB|nr:SulP family inorganic anion transporter [uncultured Microscilla sp.]
MAKKHKHVLHKENYLGNLQFDLPAGLVVFLVAIPLCLGIALGSQPKDAGLSFPIFAGIISGIIGGIIVPILSQSQLSVSGPAAGLTAVVAAGVFTIGSFNGFLVAVFLAGLIQILLGVLRAGFIAYYIPSSVIKGMLAAIGITLILKELPHAIGYDPKQFSLAFYDNSHENTFTAILHATEHVEWGALIITVISLIIMITWDYSRLKDFRWLPSALIVVVLGIVLNEVVLNSALPALKLNNTHRVSLPTEGILSGLSFPNWDYLFKKEVWIIAVTIGLIASVETLLTVEAVDKLDPYKRKSPLDRELIAQGLGNTIAGLIGGLPITSVIVRSSASINAGGRTKMAAFFHGVLLLISVLFIARYLNLVPLASLAAILLVVGYKLAKPSVFKLIYKKGWEQFIPFLITIVSILLTDLLVGVTIGIVVGLFFVIRSNFHSSISVTKDGDHVLVRFNKDASFLNKPLLLDALESIEENSHVVIDGTRAQYMDSDISELLDEFQQEAKLKNIKVELRNVNKLIPV